MSAQVALARRDVATAEARLRAAIEADPANLAAYGALGRLFLSQRRLAEAQREFEALASRQTKPIAALTMVGMILQAQGRTADAQQRYEQVLKLDRQAPVAANNLAWIYAEQGTQLGLALDLAQAAKAALPNVPEVNDTLGFVYLKRDVPTLAIPPLGEAVAADPSNPFYHQRLGEAMARAGRREDARKELETALRLKPDFPGAAETKRLLDTLR